MTELGSDNEQKKTLRQRVAPLVRLTQRVAAASWPLTVVLLAAVILTPIASLLGTIAGGRLVGAVPAAIGQGWQSDAGRQLQHQLGIVGLLFVAGYVLQITLTGVAAAIGRRVDVTLRNEVAGAALRPDSIAHLENPTILDQISLVIGAGLQQFTVGLAASSLPSLVVRYLGVIGSVVLVGAFRWWLPLVGVAALLWVRIAMTRHLKVTISAMIDTSGVMRRATYYTDLALRPDTAKENRIFGLGTWLSGRLGAELIETYRPVWRRRAESQRTLYPSLAVVLIVFAGSFLYIGHAGLTGELDLSEVTIVLTAFGGLMGVMNYGNEDLNVEQGTGVLPVIEGVIALLNGDDAALPGSRPADGLPGRSIRFEGVGFHYPGTDRMIYESLDLELVAGQSVAIVGVNGAGKTTLIKLLARLYDPTTGRITVDGIPLTEIAAASWQQRVAAIFQDFVRYEVSARDNVGFGALDAIGDDDALRKAAERAGAVDVLDHLPDGWDTPLSRRFRGGIDPSGGQWQRIALARALVAVDHGAGVLVLDEPTSNLDVRAEVELYDRFLELTRGITSVVVSHRFSTVRRADRIVVIDDGRVVEDGSHDELIAHDGHYARMFRLQSARFHDREEVVELG